jgi:glycosyltransferase involved in cell wall biosynthesis
MVELRICHVINSLTHGGAEHLLIDLTESLDDIETTVVFFGGDDALQSQLEAACARVVCLEERARFDPFAAFRLTRFLRREQFDVVHAHLPYAESVARIAASLARGSHIVSTQHNVPDHWHPVVRMTERLTRPLDDATVAVSQGVERAFTGTAHEPNTLSSDQWVTIYNGIDTTGFAQRVAAASGEVVRERLGIDTDTTIFLNVARCVPQKNQADLIRGLAKTEFEAAELVIVGTGPEEERLRELADETDINEHVHVTGRVPEVEPYYAAADVFISGSRVEGLPVTLLEAMAAALPVIASDIPGPAEVVIDGETGLLFPEGNIVELHEAMESLLDEETAIKLGRNGRERVQEVFDIERMADGYRRLYCSLVDAQ